MSQPNEVLNGDLNGDGNGPFSQPPSIGETMRKLLKPVASLQLTVVLFFLGMILVFYGTLAQIDQGIWTVVEQYFKSFVVLIPLDLNAKFCIVFCGLDPKTTWYGKFPFPGGLTIGSAMLINLLAAHIVRFKFRPARIGIIMIHAGVISLLVGELITKFYAAEGVMSIPTGKSANYVEDLRHVEFAITDSSGPDVDAVTLVPGRRIARGGEIRDDKLPFNVRVDKFMVNSHLEKLPPGEQSRATRGIGLTEIAQERPEISGTDPKQNIDYPAAYVTLSRKDNGEPLGTYLVGIELGLDADSPRQEVTVGDKTYSIALRLKRTYKPYTIHLKKFDHAVYAGTTKAKDFASTVQLVDPEYGEDREVRIWMNNPLRHRGETLYQQSFFPGDNGTILQVVKNPAWMVPWISCVVVAAGLILHFILSLVLYLTRRSSGSAAVKSSPRLSASETWFPYAVVGVMFLIVALYAMPPSPKEDAMNLYDAGQIPVQTGGRTKPLDTAARVPLLLISSKSSYFESRDSDLKPDRPDESGRKALPAIHWLLGAMADGRSQDGNTVKQRIVRIDNDQILNLLELKHRPGFYRYSLAEILPRAKELEEAWETADRKEKTKRDAFDVKLLELRDHLSEYMKLLNRSEPGFVPGPRWESLAAVAGTGCLAVRHDDKWATLNDIDREVAAQHRSEIAAGREKVNDEAMEKFSKLLEQYGITDEKVKTMRPEELMALKAKFTDLEEGLFREHVKRMVDKFRGDDSPQGEALARILKAFRARDVKEFNAAVADYHRDYDGRLSEGDLWRVRAEAYFNHVSPFDMCMVLYIFVFVFGALAWLGWTEPLRRSALGLMILTFAIHTTALITRMVIQGRPPVTNLYSSAVFIGWGSIGLCILLEFCYRRSVGNVVGAVLGFSTMAIANFLGGSGDSLEMMEAVLDTNFWLATHVTCVSLGYTMTFVAGFISIVYLVLGMFTKMLDPETNKRVGEMIYGVVCFAMLMSFVGTVLGGLWADQSWGRFWGWDAKENGAVLVVIWNAMILHARWCGLVKQRGMAVMAIAGNMVTVWSWFGTNQLGAGLHTYGNNNQLAMGCLLVWIVLLGIIGVGLVPLRYWQSFCESTVRKRAEDARIRQQLEKKQSKEAAGAMS